MKLLHKLFHMKTADWEVFHHNGERYRECLKCKMVQTWFSYDAEWIAWNDPRTT